MCIGICPPSKPTGMVSRAPWPLVPRPAVLPPLPAIPRPTRLRSRLEPGTGFRSWTFIVPPRPSGLLLHGAVDLLHGDEVGHPSQHAPDLRAVGQDMALADAAEPQGAEGAALLGLLADAGVHLGDLELAHHATSFAGLADPPRSLRWYASRNALGTN